jgi:predicted PurR-regulated permease PerM
MKVWTSKFRYWIITLLLILAAVFIWYIRALITPLVIAALLAYILNPLVNFFTLKVKIPRGLSASIVLILSILILSTLPVLTIPTLVSELEILSEDLLQVLSDFQELISEPIIFADQVIDLTGIIPDYVEMLSSSFLSLSENVINIVENITKNLILILLILATTFYLLRDYNSLRNWFYNKIPEAYKEDGKRIYIKIREIWAGYMKGNVSLMFIVGIAFSIAWVLIGVPGALALGLIAGLLTIIPDLGPAIAAALAVIVGLIEGSDVLNVSNVMFGLIIFIIYMVLINIKGIWIRPKIFAKSVHMHEGIVFAAIIMAVMIQGILGALVIIPLMASVSIVIKYIYNKLLDKPMTEDEF